MGRGKKNKQQYKQRQTSTDNLPVKEASKMMSTGPCNTKPAEPKFFNHLIGDDMKNLFRTKENKFFTRLSTGPISGLVPIEIPEEVNLGHRFFGKKITMGLWNQILSFLKWSFDETKSETVVHLFYNGDLGWTALVKPQKGYTGMTIVTLPEHPNTEPTMQRLDPAYWSEDSQGNMVGPLFGTVHHHCSSTAYQSGPDFNDEKTTEGLHITIGKLDEARFDISGRYNIRGTFTEPNYSDWFELDEAVLSVVPPEMHSQLLKYNLTKKPPIIEFPEHWKENVIKQVPATTNNLYGCGSSTSHSGYGYQGGSTYHNSHGGSNYSFNDPSWLFTKEMEEICQENNLSLEEILSMYQIFEADKPWNRLIEILVKDHTHINRAIQDVEKLILKRNAKIEEIQKKKIVSDKDSSTQIDALSGMDVEHQFESSESSKKLIGFQTPEQKEPLKTPTIQDIDLYGGGYG